MRLIRWNALMLLIATWAASSVWAAGGHEILNGGSVVVNGDRYELVDLHFVPITQESFRFDAGLDAELHAIQGFLKERFGVSLETKACTAYRHCQTADLFKDFVFNPFIEYQFVAERPGLCQSGRSEIGCSSGSITYVIPGRFVKLSLQEKALFILEERLETMFPNESEELKREVLRDVGLLLRLRGRTPLPWRQLYSAEEVEVLNGFIPRLQRLLGRDLRFGLRFARSGGFDRFSTVPPGVIQLED